MGANTVGRKLIRKSEDEFRNGIINYILDLIEAEPDIDGWDFGFGRQGSHCYVTVLDPDKGLRTFEVKVHESHAYRER